MKYDDFLRQKMQDDNNYGFKSVWLPDYLKDFQAHLTDWSLYKGRSALFEDCGLGKTIQQLVWAENVAQHTGGKVLILTPLAVSSQTVMEGEKFGVVVERSLTGDAHRITVTNYERLHYFNPLDFKGVVCDESSILKSFNGAIKQHITMFMRKVPYRLLATATPSPNDYPELGTSSEALGYLGHMDMLGKFFKNDQNNCSVGRRYGSVQKWRLKGHAEQAFWRWVCSWSRAIRKPSDIGFDDTEYNLPGLTEIEHVVHANTLAEGMLFALPAVGLKEQREERRRTIEERCEMVANIVNPTGQPALVWCHLNDEGDMLERMIPDAIQVSGRDSDEAKEEKLMGFAQSQARVLITKPTIGAWGLNFQHCNHMTFFPSHSFEQYYQGVRRCWRFGQTRPVTVDVVTTEGEKGVLANLRRKSDQADQMFSNLVAEMDNVLHLSRSKTFNTSLEIPTWLS